MILRNPQFLALLILVPLLIAGWLWRRGRVPVAALSLRLMIVTLIVVAIADPVVVRGRAGTGAAPLTVLLVDQSDSLAEEGRAALRARAAAIAASTGGAVQIITFGATVAAEHGAGAAPRADQTDIAAALRVARGLIGTGGGRVVLLSDGVQTSGNAFPEAQALARDGIPVDTVIFQVASRPEFWIAAIEAPATLREGEEFTARVVVASTVAAEARLELTSGAEPLLTQQVRLAPGENAYPYTNRAGAPGVLRLQATIAGQPDTLAQNNAAAATILVAPMPRILLVEGQPDVSGPLRDALRRTGVVAESIDPASLPSRLSALGRYEGIVLLDVPAGELTLDQMATLREFVRSEGRGLVAVGGRSSLTLGAYKDTPLEETLPVTMTPRPRPERSDITLLLIIDQSASMGPETGVSKFTMAKEAAILASESLREEDRIGVLAFDVSTSWVVDFQRLGAGLSLADVQRRISALPLGGGTDIYGALQDGLPALAQQPGQVRHAVLLTDGRSFTDDRQAYQALIERARSQNITLSAIAIGSDADTALLRDLARWGAGRYHFADRPGDIPRLTLLESDIARTEPQVEGDFRAEQVAPHPMLRDFTPEQIPGLNGYVATTIKPGADLVLRAPEGDPVLAVWQYGLGRAVAWTPSAEAPWATDWSNWADYGRFWAQIIRYTLPEPDSGPLQVRAIRDGDTTSIIAESVAPNGEPLDLADTQATVTLPDGSTRLITLRQTAPGRYEQALTLPADGAYAIEVRQRKGDEVRAAQAGYVHRYSDEYLPPDPQAGARLLHDISAVTGGTVLQSGPAPSPSGATAPLAQVPSLDLWPWLLGAAALLWPVEIAMRRGWLRLRRAA
ncbi:MAG: VWA domain-containing protein [Chloroflexi bacterium]|nr:VWA domain-containing protein [Chloroflexota bacterium]